MLADGRTGTVHYIALQLDQDPRQGGPTVQFNEMNLGGGSLVSEDWKEGVKQAVAAAMMAVGADGREWGGHEQKPVIPCVDRRNERQQCRGSRYRGSLARRRHQVRRGALSGKIMPDGQIEPVGALPLKVEAAARAQFRTVLVPRDQLYTADWDLSQLAARWNIKVLEVATLEEASQLMTTTRH